MIVALLAVVVLLLLGISMLSLSFSEDFNQRRDRSRLLAFFAAEGGVHEAVARMNLAPGSPTGNEVSLPYPGNPAAVRDPRIVQGNQPDPDPRNYSDSSTSMWRFWNYDPSWRYTGTSSGGEGNYPGATSAQQANLDTAGRPFTLDATSSRTLAGGSTFTARVAPHVRNVAGTWTFVNERGAAAASNYYYYKIATTGTQGAQTATAEVILKKFFFGPNIPAAVTAGGDVVVGGNGSVSRGEGTDANLSGVAIQSAGNVSISGSGTTTGTNLNHTAFPGFQTVFGITPTELQAQATITATYTANNTTNPSVVPSGTVGQIIWLTAKESGVKKGITFTGSGPGGYTLGSPTQPVILVVDGDLTLNSVTIYGVIYVTGALRNQGGSNIDGGVLVEGTTETDILGTGSTGSKIQYSAGVLKNLNGNSNMFPFRFVKGSWKLRRG